jgi:D-alanyl-D-alanine carboxypeptidase (penicillin-binding protein 5/6)
MPRAAVSCLLPRRVALWLAALVLLGGVGFGPPQWLERDSAPTALAPAAARAAQAARPPVLTARNVALLDAATGRLLYARAAEERVAPASLTKMMTALVALELGQPQQRITATPDVYVEPVVIGLDAGETMTLEDLLYGLLLPSGNDAAVAIAEGVGGSIPQFVAAMNRKAAELGLRNTHFMNPHGLDQPGHYSTAYDLARLLAALMQQPLAARIVGTRVHTVPGPPLYQFRNSNPLLGVVPGVDGGKTGFTDLAGRCLAVTAQREGHRVVAVVLNSQNPGQDAQALLEFAYTHFEWVDAAQPAARLLEYQRDRERLQARVDAATVAVPLWERAYLRVQVLLEEAAAPTGPLGRLRVESPLGLLGEFPLLAGGAR